MWNVPKRQQDDDGAGGRAFESAAPLRDGKPLAQDFPAALADWSPGTIGTTLARLYAYAIQTAEKRIAWYNARGSRMGRRSRRLRLGAILFGTAGTLFPLVDAAWNLPASMVAELGVVGDASSLGYVFLAVAAALVAADSAFGVSSSWMRFRATQIEMERLLAAFRAEWTLALACCNGQEPTAEQRQGLLELQRAFTDKIEAAAQQETTGWMQEFRGALADLASAYRSNASAAPPPSLAAGAHVTNVIETTGPIEMTAPKEEASRSRVNGSAGLASSSAGST